MREIMNIFFDCVILTQYSPLQIALDSIGDSIVQSNNKFLLQNKLWNIDK